MNEAFAASLKATVARLEAERDDIAGVVITSAKKTFFAGGDLNDILAVRKDQARGVRRRRARDQGGSSAGSRRSASRSSSCDQRRGARRRAGDLPGLPTTGSWSTTRRSRSGPPRSSSGCCRAAAASCAACACWASSTRSMQLLLQGKPLRPAKADGARALRELVASPDELVPAAKKWIAANPEAVQPWDVKGHKIPGGTPSTPSLAQNLPAFPANLRKQLKGANYPAPHHIMAAAVEGAQVDFDTRPGDRGPLLHRPRHRPGRQEHDPGVLLRPAAGQRAAAGGPRRSRRYEAKKVVVLGAGMMGAGDRLRVREGRASRSCSRTSRSRRPSAARATRKGLVDKAVERGRSTQEKADALLARITADRQGRGRRRAPTS